METDDYDAVLVMQNDSGKPHQYKDMAQEEWALPKLLFQVALQDYWENLEECMETAVRRSGTRPCILWKIPYELNLFKFTGEDLVKLALDSAKSLVTYMERL